MSRRKFFYYWLLHALTAVLVMLLCITALTRVEISGLKPLVVLFLPAIVATYNPLRHNALYAGTLGIACDLLVPGPLPIFYLLTFELIAVASFLLSRRMQPTLPCSLAVCFVAWFITGLTRLFLLSMAPRFSFSAAMAILTGELLISLPVMVLLHYLFVLLRRHLSQV